MSERAELSQVSATATPTSCWSVTQCRLLSDERRSHASRNVSISVRLRGPVDAVALEAALHDVIARHDALRMTCGVGASATRAEIADPTATIDFEQVAVRDEELPKLIASTAGRAFDLAVELPIRARLFAVNTHERVVLLVLHHLAIDAWSVDPLAADLSYAYATRRDGRAPQWAPAESYLEYARGQQKCRQMPAPASPWANQLKFWSDALASALDRFPNRHDGRTAGADEVHSASVSIDAALHRDLLALALEHRVSLFMVLHAALGALLAGSPDNPSLIVGAVVSGRTEPKHARTVGLFENAVLLRADVTDNPSFGDLLHRGREQFVSALASQDVPVAVVLDGLQATDDALGVMLGFMTGRGKVRRDRSPADTDPSSLLTTTLRPGSSFRGVVDTLFSLVERRGEDGSPRGIDCDVEHRVNSRSSESAGTLLAHFVALLRETVADSTVDIRTLRERCRRHALTAANDLDDPAAAMVVPSELRWGAGTPPQDVLQDQLVDVWESVLGIQPIGIHDDFWGLGGSPAVAASMLDAVNDLCGTAVDQTAIVGPMTISNLADALVAALPMVPIVELQQGDAGVAPLFFFHGDLAGGGLYVRALAKGLGAHRPVYSLRQHGTHGEQIPISIEAMAEEHLATIRRVRPHGPYVIGGYCNGACIAYEVGLRLVESGDVVVSMLLVEPTIRIGGGGRSMPPEFSSVLQHPRLWEPMADPTLRRPWCLTRYLIAVQQYRPRPYPGKVVVLCARHGAPDRADPRSTFAPLVRDLDVRVVPGTHISALGRHVAALAAEMSACLDAEPARSATSE